MRLRSNLFRWAAAAALGSVVAAADLPANLEFVGVAQSSSGCLVALKDGDSASRWTRVGGRFGEYRVAHYDSVAEVVTLEQGASTLRLALRAGRVADVEQEVTDRWALPAVRRNLHLLAQAACQHFWEADVPAAEVGNFVGVDRALQRVESVAGEDYASLRFGWERDGTLTATDARGVTVFRSGEEPLHIAVTAGTTLSEIARRLGLTSTRLATLNPDFEPGPASGPTRSVRLR